MSGETSRHLRLLADHVQSGAHVVLRGHLGDAVLLEGEIRDELWAIGKLLGESAGIDFVLAANRADGLFCVDEEQHHEVGELIGSLRGVDLDVALGPTTATGIARTVRLLLRQTERSVAILLQDAANLIGTDVEQGREVLSILLEAIAEAELAGEQEGLAPPHNTLVVYGSPGNAAVEQIAAVPGVVEQVVERPDRKERFATLRVLAGGFYAGEEEPPGDEDLKSLARVTHDYSLRGLEQLRRRSHAVRIPASRPESLYRAARGEPTSTPIDRVGVEEIVRMLHDEIVGQPQAMEDIRKVLERGRWRSANRPPGATVTRPMAKLVLHGPPGVGKTETGLILAEAILGSRDAVRRIDCAEFQADHDVARLTGAPPGYIGYEDGGVLSDALQESATVIVLDEFDRGPPRLAEMLLGILDAGRLTDGRGRTATFENALLILTTNAGSEESERLKSTLDQAPDTEEMLHRSAASLERKIKYREGGIGLGSPALWSRLQDSLVGYDILRRDAFDRIVAKACVHLAENLGDEYGVGVSFDAERFSPAIFDLVPDNWDGRSIFPRVQECIEVPTREALEQLRHRGELAADRSISFVPDESGRASTR